MNKELIPTALQLLRTGVVQLYPGSLRISFGRLESRSLEKDIQLLVQPLMDTLDGAKPRIIAADPASYPLVAAMNKQLEATKTEPAGQPSELVMVGGVLNGGEKAVKTIEETRGNGAEITEAIFLIEIENRLGRERLQAVGVNTKRVFEGEELVSFYRVLRAIGIALS